jgi:hypothetical protein
MIPYRPAFAAAFNNSVPAVITPLPPLPAMATEMLASTLRRSAPLVARITGWAIAFTVFLLVSGLVQVNRVRGRMGLIQINAPVFPLAHHIARK